MFISTMILSLLMPIAAEGLDEQVKQAAAVGLLSGDKPATLKDALGRTSMRAQWSGNSVTFHDERGRTIGKGTISGDNIRFSDAMGRRDGHANMSKDKVTFFDHTGRRHG